MSDATTPPPSGDEPNAEDATGVVGIADIEIQEEMERSFLDYAMSVIVSRALPDARDGLKPVHRRILWGMHDLGARPDRPTVKCAKVTGEVMGNYHPHGDTAIYDALVRMGQTFSLLHPLVHPKGNFGSPDDPPAAARYTECRLSPMAMEMLAGIDEDTVDMVENYSGDRHEPTVLPSRLPNLLVNGSQGIAVGMATNIPPHNLREVIDATVHLLEHPDASVGDLMAYIGGPDFPTGAQILGRRGIGDAYLTGRGSIKMRAVCDIEEGPRTSRIVVTELPYQVSVGQVVVKIKELVDRKEVEGIRDLNDESAGGKTRLVIDLKKDAPANVILNNLYKRTPLQTSFGANMVALVDGVPRTLDLAHMLRAYVDHQREVVRRRSEFRLRKAGDRAHIVEGLLKAIDAIDAIIALIRGSDDRAAARTGLMAEPFEFTEVQANHILDMPLGRLTRLGRSDLNEELEQLRATIAELEAILGDDAKLRAVIADELGAIRAEFGRDRRTDLQHDPGEFDIEDLIDDEELVFTLTRGGYVKTTPIEDFRTQGRGGVGVRGAALKDGDVVERLLSTSAHAYLLFFTTRGRVYRRKAHQIPLKERTARGTALVNLLQLEAGEEVSAVIDTRDYETNPYLVFVTRNGKVKKSRFSDYDSSRDGLWAIRLEAGDELVRVVQTAGNDHVLLVTAKGQGMRFDESEARPMGRVAAGVRGVRFKHDDDRVVSAVVIPGGSGGEMLAVSTEGYGKRTDCNLFDAKHRGGMGVRAFKITEAKGEVASAFLVEPDDEIFIINSSGTMIRTAAAAVSTQGRDASGVRVMSLDDDETVAAVAKVLLADEGPDPDA
ncbi:MAG TPA: DNA gyrase subunit A [Acidimicrobiales bacterium]